MVILFCVTFMLIWLGFYSVAYYVPTKPVPEQYRLLTFSPILCCIPAPACHFLYWQVHFPCLFQLCSRVPYTVVWWEQASEDSLAGSK